MLFPTRSRVLVLAAVLTLVATSSVAQVPIYEARQQGADSSVAVEGTVTRAYGDFVRLQDDSGPTGASALVVRQTSGEFHNDIQDETITRGTQLQVSGTLSEFNGLLQINEDDLSGYSVGEQGSVPDPQNVTLSDIQTNGEDYESELVLIEGLEFQDASGTFDNGTSYTVTNGQETLPYRVQGTDETNFGGVPIPSGQFDYEGVTGEFQGEYQLLPIRNTTTTFRFGRLYATAQEGDNSVSVDVQASNVDSGNQVTVTAEVGMGSTAENGVDVTGFESPETLTFSGTDPAPQTLTFEPVDDTEQEGVERLEVTLQSSDGVVAAPQTFTLWLLDDETAQGPVADGQTGDPLINQLQQTYGNPSTLGYDVARDTMFSAVYGARGDSLRGVYTGFAKYIPVDADPTVAACNDDPGSCTDRDDINTEHAWPQSLGAGEEPARSNMHILFPARADVNTARSNNPYGEIPDSETDEWFVRDQFRTEPPPEATRPRWSETLAGSRFEPRDSVKGDVARAMFYFRTIYPNRANASFYNTQRETLLEWHQEDPVDAAEMQRNIRQASYQGNKLNPFVVDPSLADRAYGSGADAGVPTNLTANSEADAISLSWTASSGIAEGYHVYRFATSFQQVEDATRLTNSPISETEYTDTMGELGDRYVYAVTAVEPDGEETALSDRVTGVFYPSTVSATVERSFGDLSTEDSYRLVALPGAVDRGLGQTLEGDVGVDWQAYWDNGQSEDFFVRFEESDPFAFRPGRGFWLLSESDWQVELSVDAVSLSEDGTTTIPLHDGWNIISNPLPVDVSWVDVEAANGDSLQALWAWTGGGFEMASTFATAASGEAFYFLNDRDLEQLTIPVSSQTSGAARTETASSSSRAVTLGAHRESDTAMVQVAERQDAKNERDRYDLVAPPTRFSSLSLHSRPASAADQPSRQQALARDVRPDGGEGHTYPLTLRADTTGPVTLRAEDLPRTGAVVLLDSAGTRHDLRQQETVTLTAGPQPTRLQLLVGEPSYVEAEAAQQLPDQLSVEAPRPNPFRERVTLQYTLPSTQEVRVAVYDVLGRQVQTLVDGRKEAGPHRTTWDGVDQSGGTLASGVYFVRWTTEGTQHTERVLLVR